MAISVYENKNYHSCKKHEYCPKKNELLTFLIVSIFQFIIFHPVSSQWLRRMKLALRSDFFLRWKWKVDRRIKYADRRETELINRQCVGNKTNFLPGYTDSKFEMPQMKDKAIFHVKGWLKLENVLKVYDFFLQNTLFLVSISPNKKSK